MDQRQQIRALIAERKFERLRQLSDGGDSRAKHAYARLLRLHEDEAALRPRAEHYQLACLLAHQERVDDLRTLVDTQCPQAEHLLADLLAEHEDFDGARRLG